MTKKIPKKIIVLMNGQMKEVKEKELKEILKRNKDFFKFESTDGQYEFWNFDDGQVRPLLKNLLRINRISVLTFMEKMKLFFYIVVVLAIIGVGFIAWLLKGTIQKQNTTLTFIYKELDKLKKLINDNTKVMEKVNSLDIQKINIVNSYFYQRFINKQK